MAVRSRSVSIIALLALPLSVGACGGGDTENAAPSAAPPRTVSTAPSAAATTTADASSAAPSAGPSADKPSRDEVKQGYLKAVRPAASKADPPLSEADLQKLAPCVVDQLYDDVSVETLTVLASGDSSRKMPDLEAFRAANVACGKALRADQGSTTGKAPAGAVIKAGAGAKPPAKVGSWKKKADSSGPIATYDKGDESVNVSFLPGSKFDAIVEYVKKKRTKAGTGVCGEGDSSNTLICYLKAEDGVVSLSTSPSYASLPGLVGFANELTETMGTK